jgi:hypothetical protein
MSALVSGGCQCGAVRFRAGNFGRASICHCRMCQKAFGGFFAALVSANEFELTRGTLRHFQSSNRVKRGFCADCGTPLTFEPDNDAIEVAIGALDNPAVAPPTIQVNPTDKQPFCDGLCSLPTRPDGAEPKEEAFKASLVNYQHPDHDTETWPPGRGA